MTALIPRGIRSLIRSASAADDPAANQRALVARADGWYDRDPSGKEYRLDESYATTVVTNASGVATVTFPAGKFSAAPVVSTDVEAVTPSGTVQPTQVEITAVTKDSVSVRSWRQQVTLLNALGLNITPSVVTSAKVHIIARPPS